MKRFTVLVWRQFNYPVPVLDKSWFKMLVSGKSVDGSPCLALLCVCANCRWILLVHSSRTFLIVISLEGLINFIHYIFLRKYCFLFPGKRNLESTAWGCWSLCDFAPVNFPWSHLSSAAFPCCCFRSFLAQSGGLNSVCEGDREREWWCAEAWDDSPRSSPASLEWPLGLQLYGCNLFTARDLVCDLSFAIELYNKKNQNKGIIKKRSAKRRSGNGGRQRKQLNSEMPRDLKTPYTLEPILPAVCEKKCFLLLSFLSQRKTTLIP